MNFRSVAQLSDQVHAWSRKLPRDIDLIVGIPRSGLLAANLLALYRDLRLTDLEGFLENRLLSVGRRSKSLLGDGYLSEARNVLVVDDSVATGKQIAKAKAAISEAGLPHRVRYGAVYIDTNKESLVDFYAEKLSMPRVFEWNVMHHNTLDRSCVDMDGVLCVDPKSGENDDSSLYLAFLNDASPLLAPKGRIGWIVTSRIEKYRAQTEDWLARHGITYGELVMLDYPDGATRLRLKIHSAYKADVYRQVGAQLFIESSVKQAFEIANLALKPVLCIDTMQFIQPGMMPMHRPILQTQDLHILSSTARLKHKVRKVLRGITGAKGKK